MERAEKKAFFRCWGRRRRCKTDEKRKEKKKREEREEREEKEEKEERERRRKREEKEGKERGKESISRKGEGKTSGEWRRERGRAVGWAARDEGGHSGAT